MKKGFTSLLIILTTFVLGAFGQKAEPAPEKKPVEAAMPSAKHIVDKYVTAIGGKDAYLKVKSRVSSGSIELSPMGIKGSFETLAESDAKSYSKLTLAGIGDILEGSDGKTVWTINPIQGNRVKAGKELQQNLLTYNFYKDVNLDTLYDKLEVIKKDKVNNRDVFVVKATKAGLPDEAYYFDAENGLLLRTDSTAISPEGEMASTSYYDDYRAVDGIMFPYKLRAVLPQFEIITTVTSVKHNVEVDQTKFAMPK